MHSLQGAGSAQEVLITFPPFMSCICQAGAACTGHWVLPFQRRWPGSCMGALHGQCPELQLPVYVAVVQPYSAQNGL
jgi:hypothetical protein